VNVVITGGFGFVGWHTACRLRALHAIQPIRTGRRGLSGASTFGRLLAGVDTIIHLAGVNRAESDEAVEGGNHLIAEIVAGAIEANGRPVHLVYGNSIQSLEDNPYGRGKRAAGEVLSRACERVGGTFANVVLPNLFGEHGRPDYNSFVATFSHVVAHNQTPRVTANRTVPLLHAQDAATALIDAMHDRTTHEAAPRGQARGVEDVLALLKEFHSTYGKRGELPDLSSKFSLDLFNTYRSYLFPDRYPFRVSVNSDARGTLFETSRSHGGTAQSFLSTTMPGATRGNHYHLHKVERFFVVKGEAEIAVRRLYDDDVVRFRIRGDSPCFVDMPTMWAHSVRNVGDSELVTVFWANQLLDPANPDQYAEHVEPSDPSTRTTPTTREFA